MELYHVGKLVQWAGTLESRKRLQKVVYLLEFLGCPLHAEHYLHHFGPYSQEVASLTDELVRGGVLHETSNPFGRGVSYSYSLDEGAKELLSEFEQTERGAEVANEFRAFEEPAKALLNVDLPVLELASTIAYYQREEKCSGKEAVLRASEFKPDLAANAKFLDVACRLVENLSAQATRV